MAKSRWQKSTRSFSNEIANHPIGPVSGVLLQFGRTLTWISSVKLVMNGRIVELLVNGTRRRWTRYGNRNDSTIYFHLKLPEDLTAPPSATLEVRGRYRGVQPTSLKVVWLHDSGQVVDLGAPPTVGETGIENAIFTHAETDRLNLILGTSHRDIMGRRLLKISQLPHNRPLALRQGGTFFHDLDESTHSDGMGSARAKRVMVLREVLYTRALQRAAQRPSLDSLDDVQRDFEEIQTQFIRLVTTHFPARKPTEPYDGENMFAAVRAFVFAELPRVDIHGTPDSSYYFCFTELFGAFVEIANSDTIEIQQRYWLPALKAFVMHGFAFSELYARFNSKKKEAYVGAQVRNMTHHMENTAKLVAQEHAGFLDDFGGAPVSEQWQALLAVSARNVAQALENDLDGV